MFYIITAIILVAVGLGFLSYVMFLYAARKHRADDMRDRILREQREPSSAGEADLYESLIRNQDVKDPRFVAWVNFLLLKYYMQNYNNSKDLLFKAISFGENIRRQFGDFPFYGDALFMLGNIYFFDIFDFNKARDIYQQIIDEKGNSRWKSICEDRVEIIQNNIFYQDVLKLYVTAERYFEEAKYEDAEYYLNRVIEEYPESEMAGSSLYFLGDINYYKYTDLDRALKYYRTMEKMYPHHALSQHALYKAGEILRKMGRWEEAIAAYREYIKKYKKSPYRDDAYYYIGECFQKLGKLRQAKNSFNLILGDYPNSKWNDVIYHKVQEINKVLAELQ